MNFCTIRDLRNNSKKLWGDDDVIITNNGKPKGILIKTDDEKCKEPQKLDQRRSNFFYEIFIKIQIRMH